MSVKNLVVHFPHRSIAFENNIKRGKHSFVDAKAAEAFLSKAQQFIVSFQGRNIILCFDEV